MILRWVLINLMWVCFSLLKCGGFDPILGDLCSSRVVNLKYTNEGMECGCN